MATIRAGGLEFAYETFGDPARPAIVLIMGLGGQLVMWPDSFCEALAAGGYHVVRFDNRDIGLSSKLDHLGKPRLLRMGLAYRLGLPLKAPYTLADMGADTIAVMDALKLKTAHLIGVSMGGMIAQQVATQYPARVRSLTSIMSNSGSRKVPGASLKLQMRLIRRPTTLDREGLITHGMQTWRLIGSPAYPDRDDELRAKVERQFDRSHHPQGMARQTAAIMASPSRVPQLQKLKAPTLIIHGQQDPLVPVAAAHDLARHIPHAQLEIIEGMGHDLPRALLPRIEHLILHHLKHAERDHSRPAVRDSGKAAAVTAGASSAASPGR